MITREIKIIIVDNKSVLMAYRDGLEDHIYWGDSPDYREILADFKIDNPEYEDCDINIVYE